MKKSLDQQQMHHYRTSTFHIECFHSRGQHLCKFVGTKESVCIRKEFNSQRTGLGHQHGRRFIVLGHQCGRRDVMWKHSILYMLMRLQIPFLVFIYIFFSTGMGVHGIKSSKHWLTIPSAIFFIFNRIAQQQVKNVWVSIKWQRPCTKWKFASHTLVVVKKNNNNPIC